MAVCRRCGAVYNYEKREGVCPKCCFFNRPEGSWQEDDSWIKNYNYEDNSYNISEHEVYDKDSKFDSLFSKDRNDVGAGWRDAMKHGGNTEVDGSHTHMADGSIVRGSGKRAKTKTPAKKTATSSKPGAAGKKSNAGCIGAAVVIFWLYVVLNFVMSFIFR